MEKQAVLKWRPKIDFIWGFIVLMGIFVIVNISPIRSNDFWFHLAYGRLIVQSGRVPIIDTFSFTMAGQPFYGAYNYWLGQIFMYWLFAVGGPEWTIFIFSLSITAGYSVLYFYGIRTAQNWRQAAFVVLFAALLGVTNWSIRPQSLILLPAALTLAGIEFYRAGYGSWRWGVVMMSMMTIWTNCHGTFFIPFLISGFWFGEVFLAVLKNRQYKTLMPPLKVLGMLIVAVLLNPRGYKIFFYIFTLSSDAAINYVTEWQPPLISEFEGMVFYGLLTAMIILWVVSRRKASLSQVLTFLFFAVLAIRYKRAILWFGFTQAPLLLSLLQAVYRRYKVKILALGSEYYRLNITLFCLFLIFGLISLPWFDRYLPTSVNKLGYFVNTPEAAVEYLLENEQPRRIYAEIGFSSYIDWIGNTQYKVFTDTRINFYPVQVWDDYLSIQQAAVNWNDILSAYDIDTLILSHENQGNIIAAAQDLQAWQEVYSDEIAVVFTRSE
ncbi:MAG: hypothetical protein JXA13_08360 [Anaerolineales bacterium]|nr:hypothetical protein [Anaerolineales bacterium]